MQNCSDLQIRARLLCAPRILLVCLGMFFASQASAEASLTCPTINASIESGGMAVIDVSDCDGPFDGGMSGPIAPNATHGSVAIGKNSGGVQVVTYKHNGNSATSDVFYLEDNENGVVTVKLTIKNSKKRKS